MNLDSGSDYLAGYPILPYFSASDLVILSEIIIPPFRFNFLFNIILRLKATHEFFCALCGENRKPQGFYL